MKKIVLSTILLSASLLSATTLDEIKIEGKTAIMQMGKTLKQNMKTNMKSGGPLQASKFCTQEAAHIEDKINASYANGVSVKRVSLKYRNPKNAPTADEKAVLQEIQKNYNNKKAIPKLIVKQLSEHRYKVYKPIFLNKAVCLACHGNTQARNEKAYETIKAKYPHDKAINYKSGDLRGAFVAEIIK